MVLLASQGRLFGFDAQLLFDIFVNFANIFILLLILIPVVVLFTFICKFFIDKSKYYKTKTKYYQNQLNDRQD